MGKVFAVVGGSGNDFGWYMIGTYDEACDAMATLVATHDEDDTFMIVRTYKHSAGGLRDGQPV